jgi:rubrerythrin
MTPQEAIKTIKIAQAEVEWEYPIDYAAAFDEAVNALEKQIPKKLIFIKQKYIETYLCPNCNDFFDYAEKFNYCPNCGQRLNWKDED